MNTDMHIFDFYLPFQIQYSDRNPERVSLIIMCLSIFLFPYLSFRFPIYSKYQVLEYMTRFSFVNMFPAVYNNI